MFTHCFISLEFRTISWNSKHKICNLFIYSNIYLPNNDLDCMQFYLSKQQKLHQCIHRHPSLVEFVFFFFVFSKVSEKKMLNINPTTLYFLRQAKDFSGLRINQLFQLSFILIYCCIKQTGPSEQKSVHFFFHFRGFPLKVSRMFTVYVCCVANEQNYFSQIEICMCNTIQIFPNRFSFTNVGPLWKH